MPRTVGVVFGLSILFTTKTWRAFMSAFLHGQPSFRAVFFRLQVVLHEQDCIQIKTIGQWPVFELQSTKNIFEYSLKIYAKFTSFTTCRAIIFVLFTFISAKWEPYVFTEPSLGSKSWISPEISVSVSISSPRSETMPKYKLSPCFDRNWSNNVCSGQWPHLTTNNAQSITVSDKGSLIFFLLGSRTWLMPRQDFLLGLFKGNARVEISASFLLSFSHSLQSFN